MKEIKQAAAGDKINAGKLGIDKGMMLDATVQSLAKLNPKIQVKNPVMFIVYMGAIITTILWFLSFWWNVGGGTWYIFAISIILWLTSLFGNFAEAIAEARGKAQADSLRKTREETPAKKVEGNKIVTVSSSQLKKGDVFVCEAGDVIPSDGEIIEGLASIDESAITGESAPVIREAGGDKSSVTGGTKVLSDHIKVMVTTQPGESFLDKMIALVEGASRQKTPNEIALTILLAGFTLVGCRFQSTLPRGERRLVVYDLDLHFYFNPRSREGSDFNFI